MTAGRSPLGRDDLIASHFSVGRFGRDGRARVGFADRVANAAAAGFAAIGTSPDDYLAIRAAGTSDADMAAVLADHGMVVGEIDSWPVWVGDGEPDARHRERYEAALHLAERFGPVHHAILPLGASDPTLPPRPALVERCRSLAQVADGLGLRLSIEFVPWGPIPDAGAAWSLVEEIGHPACGVNVDFWHHLAGAADEAMLRRIPGHRIHSVHFTDGAPDPSEPSPLRRTQLQRRVPGEGDFPMVELVRTLDDMGADIPYTVEVVSLPHRHLSPADYAMVLGDASRRVLAAARTAPTAVG